MTRERAAANLSTGALMPLLLFLLSGCMCSDPVLSPASPQAHGPRIALTFDDLPYQTGRDRAPLTSDPADWAEVSDAILAALAAVGAPATIFVNCGNLAADDALTAKWRDAGHTIGNHTAHHRSAAHTELEPWMAEVRQCDNLWPAGSTEQRWFRFPYLWRGASVEQRDAAVGALGAAGYAVAPVTADTHDWMFEFVRRERLAGGASAQELAALGDLYVENTASAVDEARSIAREKLGREAVQILLLHVNHTTAEQLPEILAGFAESGIEVVSLDEAMTDPLYQETDAWAGPGARWWLARTCSQSRTSGITLAFAVPLAGAARAPCLRPFCGA